MNKPTNPLIIPTYLAPVKPIESLRIVGKLNPLLWEIFPIMLAKKNTNNPASNDPVKTTKKFRS